MAEIRWTAQAADDLEAITQFIAADSPNYARLFVMNVLRVVERLEQYPRSGRVVPEIGNPAVREIIFGNYRIVFLLKADAIEILTIYHGARLLDVKKCW